MSMPSLIALGMALYNSADDSEDSEDSGISIPVESEAEKEAKIYLGKLATEHVVNAKKFIADTSITAQEKINLLEKELNLSLL